MKSVPIDFSTRMRVLLLATLASLGAARNADGTSFCPDSYADLEWPNAKPGIVCRCVPAQNSSRSFEECTTKETSTSCEEEFSDGQNCAWSVYDWSGDDLSNEPATNQDDGSNVVNDDGTVTDCSGKTFSADDCRYRNKSDCIAYMGDGICDFGQRFTREGVRSGPNFACAKFQFDKGDCDCPDTLTCDGYCLDDRACVKDAYGFERCSDWITDNVCDYGQRTSDFGVSINFDCNLPREILDNVPGLDFEQQGYKPHDNGFCSEWDWNVRYDKQTLLDNFSAECPEPVPTNTPTTNPTSRPSSDPTDAPTEDANRQKIDCFNDWEGCFCPSKFAQGRPDDCCNPYTDPRLPELSHTGRAYSECPKDEVGYCDGSLGKDSCLQDGFDHCKYDKSRAKGDRCYARPDDGCVARGDDGSWDNKACKKLGGTCTWLKGAGYPRIDSDDDGEADTGMGMCVSIEHPCNTYVAKDCGKKSAKKGDFCEWSDSEDRCVEMVFENPSDVCYLSANKKKKSCAKLGKSHGCRYGKKGGKDKPKGGVFDKNKCFHWTDLCGAEGQQDCASLCDMEAADCAAIVYQKTASEKKVKFKSCAKSGSDRKTCLKFADKYNCYWWDGDGQMRHDGSDGEGCYEATMG